MPTPPMTSAAIVSFRLGCTDGVSVVAGSWARALRELGFDVITVAGSGRADRTVAGLAIGAEAPPPDRASLEVDVAAALADVDLVVVENLLSIPMNLPASRVVAATLRGRPSVLHHHDLPWQRPHHAQVIELPPVDPAWLHVTINDLTRRQLAERGIEARTIYNGFDVDPPAGDRDRTRAEVGAADDDLLLVHPVRAIPRKDVGAAVALVEQLDDDPPPPWRRATYWLLGAAEDGYGPELERVLRTARCRVVHRAPSGSVHDAYAAADAVLFPSTWEGFGNPPVEAALHLRPCAVGSYPIGTEVAAHGLSLFRSDRADDLRAFLADPDPGLLAANRAAAARSFSQESVVAALGDMLASRGWLPDAPAGRLFP